MWPLIKAKLPDAQLKIFYGWEYFDSTLFMAEQRKFKQNILLLLKQDGVEWCGRVGQEQLARELLQSDIMLYPPHPFRETYGIAFLEAQAAGVLIFYRKNGALGETIGNRGIPLDLNLSPEQIVNTIVETLDNKEKCDDLRKRAKEYALSRTWEKQAGKVLEVYERCKGLTL